MRNLKGIDRMPRQRLRLMFQLQLFQRRRQSLPHGPSQSPRANQRLKQPCTVQKMMPVTAAPAAQVPPVIPALCRDHRSLTQQIMWGRRCSNSLFALPVSMLGVHVEFICLSKCTASVMFLAIQSWQTCCWIFSCLITSVQPSSIKCVQQPSFLLTNFRL